MKITISTEILLTNNPLNTTYDKEAQNITRFTG